MRRVWRTHSSHDGGSLASERTVWGAGPRQLVLASHATGFCKEVYRPVVAELAGRLAAGEVLAFDHRAHGDSWVPEPPYDWWDLGRDVLSVLGGARRVVGLGHSGGAAAILLAELLEPGTFTAMVLVEPIVFPGPYVRADQPLVEAALKRKPHFANPAAALENFAGKPAFAGWRADALAEYVAGGLEPNGDRWRLKCLPESEAEFYRGATAHGGWERLGDVASDVTLIAGEHSDTHSGAFLDHMVAQLGGGHVDVVPAASHFVAMERPDLVAEHVATKSSRPGTDR